MAMDTIEERAAKFAADFRPGYDQLIRLCRNTVRFTSDEEWQAMYITAVQTRDAVTAEADAAINKAMEELPHTAERYQVLSKASREGKAAVEKYDAWHAGSVDFVLRHFKQAQDHIANIVKTAGQEEEENPMQMQGFRQAVWDVLQTWPAVQFDKETGVVSIAESGVEAEAIQA